jgi:hypothetical protein
MSDPASEAAGETEQSGVQRGGLDDCHGEWRGGGAIHRRKAARAARMTSMQGNRPQSTTRKCHAASGVTLSGNLSELLPEIVTALVA